MTKNKPIPAGVTERNVRLAENEISALYQLLDQVTVKGVESKAAVLGIMLKLQEAMGVKQIPEAPPPSDEAPYLRCNPRQQLRSPRQRMRGLAFRRWQTSTACHAGKSHRRDPVPAQATPTSCCRMRRTPGVRRRSSGPLRASRRCPRWIAGEGRTARDLRSSGS